MAVIITIVLYVAVTYPAAVADPSHFFSILLAVGRGTGRTVAGLIGAFLLFTVGMLATLTHHPNTLTHPYDIAHYPRSGAPDVASYVISDDLGGSIMMLWMFSLAMVIVGLVGGILGATFAAWLERRRCSPAARPVAPGSSGWVRWWVRRCWSSGIDLVAVRPRESHSSGLHQGQLA